MLYSLNIGDQRSTVCNPSGGIVSAADIYAAAVSIIISGKVRNGVPIAVDDFGAEEGTYVCALNVEPANITSTLNTLARALDQEAIAYAALGSRGALRAGALAGPYAAQWGAFDPDQFMLPNGRSAADAGVYA